MEQPVRSIKNQYLGINAHLHSFWQAYGLWNRFHNFYMSQLLMHIIGDLRRMGYAAYLEESLQIRRMDEFPNQPKSDLIIRDLDTRRARDYHDAWRAEADVIALDELIDDTLDLDHPYSAIGIYERRATPSELIGGQPIGWIELLSPSNKTGGDGEIYRDKRTNLLNGGLVFVELDYLHEAPPTFWKLPDYAHQDENAHPYRIAVLDPRPQVGSGWALLKEFDVDMPLPTIPIPLTGGNTLPTNFETIYQATFSRAFWGDDVDYATLPANFDRYNPADQTRIVRRMLATLEAAHSGKDLEQGPFPIAEISLEEALVRIEKLKA